MEPSSRTRSISISTERGELWCRYRLAAQLSDCQLVRVDRELNQQTADVSASVVWADMFWSLQTLDIVLHLGQSRWRWPITLQTPVVVGQSISGIAMGDPHITRIS